MYRLVEAGCKVVSGQGNHTRNILATMATNNSSPRATNKVELSVDNIYMYVVMYMYIVPVHVHVYV